MKWTNVSGLKEEMITTIFNLNSFSSCRMLVNLGMLIFLWLLLAMMT